MTLATSNSTQSQNETTQISIRPAMAGYIDALRAAIAGNVVTPGSANYDEARTIHDPSADRRPMAIVQAANALDVATAVRFSRAHEYALAVRSGGHSLAGHSMIDGVVVIDLSGMRGVNIDATTATARVQPGATSGDLAGPAHAYGFALSTGDAASVGIGGLTTGGGIGFMVRRFGLAIDNLLSAEVVTASGDIVTASPDENPDLFWAIRGGGGNFGIITEFTFRLAPVGSVLGGALVLPATPEVLRGYLEYARHAPDDLTTITNFMHAPPAPFIPEDRIGEPVLMILAVWTGDEEEGQRVLAPLRALAEPVADTIEMMPYPAMYNYTAMASSPHMGIPRAMYADAFSDSSIEAVFEAMAVATSPVSMVQFRPLGGAHNRVDAGATAYANRDRNYFFSVLGLWMDPAEDGEPHRQWTEDLWTRVRSDANGVYVNFLGDEGDARIHEAYPGTTYARLADAKAKWDPENVFRFNQNIRPRP